MDSFCQQVVREALLRPSSERCTTSVDNRLEPTLTRYLRATPQYPVASTAPCRDTNSHPTCLAYFTHIAVQLTGYTSAFPRPIAHIRPRPAIKKGLLYFLNVPLTIALQPLYHLPTYNWIYSA